MSTAEELREALREADPEFYEAYLRFSAAPRQAPALEPKVAELVMIAVDGATTHLYEPGLRVHVRRAIEHGATREELLEVLELTATMGIHAANIGVPLLCKVLDERGERPSRELDERRERLKDEFTAKRGYWHEFWHDVLVLDPDFFEAYIAFSGHPWERGALEPKVKELIYCAFDVSATHLYVPGLELHMRNALGYGATREEIMEVIELASVIGIHTCFLGVPIVLEELERAGR